jgi:hypothetical protein
LPDNVLSTFKAIPVVELRGVEDDPAIRLSIMGVRHVGGIKEWGGYQRAKLVTELRDQFQLDTGEVAARLGMTAHEVNRRYRAFKALKQMMDDEEYVDLSAPDMYPLFHEAVAGTIIKEWLGWNEESSEFTNQDSLHQFYDLIAPIQLDDNEPRAPKLTTYAEVRDLRDVLVLPEAKRRLFDPGASFADALALAKAEDLAKTWLTQVGEAAAALKSVSALEVGNLDDEALSEIELLRQLASKLLETHAILRKAQAETEDSLT